MLSSLSLLWFVSAGVRGVCVRVQGREGEEGGHGQAQGQDQVPPGHARALQRPPGHVCLLPILFIDHYASFCLV